MLDNIKIIFFDIDGTLIDMNKKHISTKMLETLIRLQERNIMVCLSTGRGPLTLPHFDGVDVDVFVTYNGSYCFNKKESIFSNPIPTEDVKKIVDNAALLKRPVSIASKDRIVANGRDKDLVKYFSFAKLEVLVDDDFEDVVNSGSIYQIMSGGCESEYDKLLHNVHHAKITAWWDRAVDIIPANGGKGVGVNKILEYYHLNKSEALAFGDGNNDIDMIKMVGTGVAMENASDELKEAADDICGSVANDGIYYYCMEHGLI